MNAPDWWSPTWTPGGPRDPDRGWDAVDGASTLVWDTETAKPLSVTTPHETIRQVRSRDRVKDLAEVFTHQREVDAMLDLLPDAFGALDIKFLEPACGSGSFLTEILRRKLKLVTAQRCIGPEQYEHRLLRAAASIYGVDISPQNVTEARARMAHVLLDHYKSDANTTEPTAAFLGAASAVLGANVVVGDTLNTAGDVELCDWQPRPDGYFVRVWSAALVPPAARGLFWDERVEDPEPVHYSDLATADLSSLRRLLEAAR